MPPRAGRLGALSPALAGLGGGDRRSVRLSRALFRGASPRSSRRRRPDQLSLAAADRAVLLALPGERLKARHLSWRRSASRERRRCFCPRARTSPRRAGTTLLGYGPRALLRFCMVRLFGAFAPTQRSADRGGRRLLPRDGGARGPLSPGLRNDRDFPATAGEWLAILGLGLGPVGLAFYVWDYGVKHGDIRLLGVAAYAAPVLSTLILVARRRRDRRPPSSGVRLRADRRGSGRRFVAEELTLRPHTKKPAREPAPHAYGRYVAVRRQTVVLLGLST